MTLSEVTNYAKDYSSIAVAITGVVIGVLTYRRAKETILQPVRTEVIKKQTDLLIELLEFIGDESELLKKADYQGIAQLNILNSMILCGSVFKDHEKVQETIKNHSGGGILDEESARMFEVVPVFAEKNDSKRSQANDRKYYKLAKQGSFKIPMYQITRERIDFDNRLANFARNPFLPASIKKLVDELGEQLLVNTVKYLKPAIEDAINGAFENGSKEVPSSAGVFNDFNHSRISHHVTQRKLREEIRRYLKIDTMP